LEAKPAGLVLKKDIMKRIKNNDLTHYFLSDHGQLPASYLASCQKFFKSLSCKPQAPSSPGHKLHIAQWLEDREEKK
jgi:hypothetical protein